MAAQSDQRAGKGACRGRRERVDQIVEQRRLIRGADRIVAVEFGIQRLALVGVAQAHGNIELVGDMEDIVREQCEVAAVLLVDVARAAEVVQPVEPGEAGDDVRARDRTGRPGERRWANARNDAARVRR